MKTITIIIKKDELIYDVMNDSHIIAKNRDTGQNVSQVYNIQADDNEDSTKNKLLRNMQEQINELRVSFNSFLSGSSGDVQADNIQDTDSTTDYTISLVVSDRFNPAYTQTIAALSHKFIKNRMLFEWFRSVKPDEANGFYEMSNATLSAIRNSFVKLPPARPTHS